MMGDEKEWDEMKVYKRKWKEMIGDETKGLKTKMNGNETEGPDIKKCTWMEGNASKSNEIARKI